MKRLPRQFCLLAAVFLALRALVPVGYMLQTPTAGDTFGFSFSLCQTQNPGLDLSLLASNAGLRADEQGVPHRHNDHDGHASDALQIDVAGGCDAWVNSTGEAFAVTFAGLSGFTSTPKVAVFPRALRPDASRRAPAQPRAPPSTA